MTRVDTHVFNRFVDETLFLKMEREQSALPRFEAIRDLLPQPQWGGHTAAIECYWKAWELAFGNLRQPAPGSGFVSNFIDTAFDDCLFMWDSAFIMMFARYGRRAFDFQRTLDNFYAHQHADGFICRELSEADGEERYERFDPVSTGPNVLPWAEWEYYLHCGDRERLARVFAPLVAYYQWLRSYRTWPDGTYWSSAWGCGMDNQPRLPDDTFHWAFSHGHMTWIDTTLQQILAARQLLAMAAVLGRRPEIADLEAEAEQLTAFANAHLWDDAQAFYCDRWRGGLSSVRSVAAYWALLADVVPRDRVPRFVEHLRNPAEFNRRHRVPSLSARHPSYFPQGNYWLGGVWAPTNYMILRGLTHVGEDALAHEIAANHLDNVVRVFSDTGTLWENYAPDSVAPGNIAKADFVGWTGLAPIAVLFEYLFGLRPDLPNGRILWDVRLLEEHGVSRYPYGAMGQLELHCARRDADTEEPAITVRSNVPVKLLVRWAGGSKTLRAGG